MSQEDVSIIKKYKKKIEKLKEHNKLYYTKDSPKIIINIYKNTAQLKIL